ncbi:unnamed protein product [Calypogeia fissa]
MDLGDSASAVAVLELGDLQGRLREFQLPTHHLTWEHLKGRMAGFTNGFCTTEITNVDMDLETTTEEALPCSHEDGPLAIVECLPAIEKELGDSVLESIVECLPRTEKELGEDGPLAIVECLPATEKELASARDNSTFLGEEELDAGKNSDASTTGLDVVQVPEGLVAGNELKSLRYGTPLIGLHL